MGFFLLALLEGFWAKLTGRKPKFLKTITIGLHDAATYHQALIEAGVVMNGVVEETLSQMPIFECPVELDLVVCPSRRSKLRPSKKLQLCPPEVGPALALAYPEQPVDEWLHFAMRPLKSAAGYPADFVLGHTKAFGRVLDICYGLNRSYRNSYGRKELFVWVRSFRPIR